MYCIISIIVISIKCTCTIIIIIIKCTWYLIYYEITRTLRRTRGRSWKHGWSKHGSSIIPSKHSAPQDLYSPCLNVSNSARTMFTPTMFSRRPTWSVPMDLHLLSVCFFRPRLAYNLLGKGSLSSMGQWPPAQAWLFVL